MDINSTPILTFTISDENRENYFKVGLEEKYTFDRIKRKFSFTTNLNQTTEILIHKDWKSREILEAIKRELTGKLPPMSEAIRELFESSVMPDIESQIDDNIDQITKSYAEEQREINPLVRDAIIIREQNPQKITKANIQFIFDTMTKEAKDDALTLKLLFYSAKSTFTNLVISLVVDSKESGAGKSYLLFLYIGYESVKYVKIYTYLSEKALYHQEGINVIEGEDGKLREADPILAEYNKKLDDVEINLNVAKQKSKDKDALPEEKINALEEYKRLASEANQIKSAIATHEKGTHKMIIFTHQIIVIPDTPEEEDLFSILMSIISQDSDRDTFYSYSDKTSKNQQGMKNVRLRGTPCILYSKVVSETKNPRAKEVNRRFPHANPSTTPTKIKNANDMIWAKFSLTDDEKDLDIVSRKDKEEVKKLMALINANLIIHSTHFGHKSSGTRMPFAKTLQSLAANKKVWDMTIQDRAGKYLSAITRVNMDFRPKLINKRTNQPYIFVLFEDVQMMYYLMQYGALAVSPYLMYWYNKVFLPHFVKYAVQHKRTTDKGSIIQELEVGLYATELQKPTSTFLAESLSTKEIMEKYVNPLTEQEIIEKIPSVIDKRTYVLKPTDTSKLTADFLEDIANRDPTDDAELEADKIKIMVKDPSAYPSKDLIKHELRRFLQDENAGDELAFERPTIEGEKGMGEKGVGEMLGKIVGTEGVESEKNILDWYTIVDENDVEITVDELIDRYYSNPEIVFQRDTNNNNTSDTGSKDDPKDASNQNNLPSLGKGQNEEIIPKEGETEEKNEKNVTEDEKKLISGNTGSVPTNFPSTLPYGFSPYGSEHESNSDEAFNTIKYAAFDLEYDIKPDAEDRQHINWFSIVDNSGYVYTKSVLDFSSYPEPEKELIRAAIDRIKTYDLTFGWYSTGVRDRKHNRGRDSDLKIFNDAIWHYDLEKIVIFDENYPYLPGIMNQMHIDLCLLYGNPIVQDNIYEDRYDENSLDVVAKGLLGEGKYKELDGPEASKLSREEQEKYVTQDAKLTLRLAEYDDFNVLKIFLDMSEKVGLQLDKICHTTPAIWWESGIAKEGGEAVLPPPLEKRDYTGGMVMEVPEPIFYLAKDHDGKLGYVIDVASQYPTGMINLNLSPETICCDCCKDDPEAKISSEIMDEINKKLREKDKRSIHYWVCRKNEGFIAELIRKYRDERLEDKRAGRKHKQRALKILINSLYGTMGQKRFAHSDYRLAEITTAFGRHVWSQMKALAESSKYNFKVIYGDTDSIFLTEATEDKLREFLDDWHAQHKDIEVEIEDAKTFECLLLPEKKHYILIPADKKNPILTKGMEGKKSDRPMWINKIQRELSNNLTNPKIIKKLFQQEYTRMESGQVALAEMVLKKKLGQDPSAYKNNCDMKIIGLAQNLVAGDSIKFYKGEKGKSVIDPKQISRKEYLDMLKDTFEKQLTPIGIDFERDIKNNANSLLMKTLDTTMNVRTKQGDL